jgi:DNA-binding transcriptional LysR family regulator
MRSALLPALAAFASAARHQNFAHAAEELHLTASAVSHHVRKLELALGVSLFQRHARGVALTPEGRLLADAAGSALGEVESVLDSLRQHRRDHGVRISVLPSLAANWLVPRLRRFADIHPDVRLSIDTDRTLVRFDEAGPDIGIRYGLGAWPGLTSRYLMDDSLQPLAPPELASRVHEPADVATLPLLADISPEGWREWFKVAGLRYPRTGTVHTLSDSADGLNAAATGLGAVLARTRLASAHLADGRLVRLPGPALPTKYAYYVVHTANRSPTAAAQAFINWLEREAAAMPL